MAKIRVCDWCGREMSHRGCIKVKEYTWSTFWKDFEWKKVELCDKCADKIKWYIATNVDTRGKE